MRSLALLSLAAAALTVPLAAAFGNHDLETVDVYATGVEIPCCGDLVSCAIANPPGWDYPTRYECHASCP